MKTSYMHYADKYLLNPTNPITLNLIGAGGIGCRMLTELARINHSLVTLGHPGLQVTLFDEDLVTTANQGRQLFADAEVGLHKAVALINRTNRFFGTNWKAVSCAYSKQNLRYLPDKGKANMYISCVDTAGARFGIAEILENFSIQDTIERSRPLYWMDLGNARYTGQGILSTIGEITQPESKLYTTVPILPFVTDEFREQLEAQIDNNEPSCSLAEALEKQDLFINGALAMLGGSLLWSLFREGMTANRGFFLNLSDLRSTPIAVG